MRSRPGWRLSHVDGDVRFEGPLRFGALAVPPWLARRVVTIPVGGELADCGPWGDEIVAIEAGTIEIHVPNGPRLTLGPGAVLWLDGIPHADARCTGEVPAVLVAIRRVADP
jgi:hypothetical protein